MIESQTSSLVLSQPEARLLLLASRIALTDEQKSLALSLVSQLREWGGFIDTARRKYSLPMVYDNVVGLPNGSLSDEVLAALRMASFQSTAEILHRQAAFDWFHESCVLASGVEYAYFKGPAIAASFYPNPMKRYYRDVDILVPEHACAELIVSMLDQGCKIHPKTDADARALARSTNWDLKAYLSWCSMPGILTPQGLLVEIHVNIDQKTYLFSTADLLSHSKVVPAIRHNIRVLSDVHHIVFSIYHHTSHLWSKLNWLADLDAICKHPGFDREAVLAYAHDLKIESTIKAALELHELTAHGHLSSDFAVSTPGVDLLRACVDGFVGDVSLEKTMRKRQRMDSLNFDWQKNPLPAWKFFWLRLRQYKPLYADFMTFPGGPRMRYAGGILVGLLRSARRRLSEAGKR